MINYTIEGGNLPVLICYPEQGQTLCTQSGAMSWMSPGIEMQTNSGGFKNALGRMFSGESIFLNEYTPTRSNCMIAFSASFPGTILPFEVTPGNGIIIQKSSFIISLSNPPRRSKQTPTYLHRSRDSPSCSRRYKARHGLRSSCG